MGADGTCIRDHVVRKVEVEQLRTREGKNWVADRDTQHSIAGESQEIKLSKMKISRMNYSGIIPG